MRCLIGKDIKNAYEIYYVISLTIQSVTNIFLVSYGKGKIKHVKEIKTCGGVVPVGGCLRA